MNLKQLTKSIFQPGDKQVSIEGDLSNESPMSNLLGGDLFKKIVVGTFITAVMLSSSMNAYAEIDPLDIIKPPPGVEVTHDTEHGSRYGLKNDSETNIVMDAANEKTKDYGNGILNFNFKKDLDGSTFVSAGLIPESMDGLDTTDFQGIDEQSSSLGYYAEVFSSPLHMDENEIYKGKSFIIEAFKNETPYGSLDIIEFMDDNGEPSVEFEQMSEEVALEHTRKIMKDINDNPTASAFLTKVVSVLNNDNGTSLSNEEVISKIVKSNTHGEQVFDVYASIDNEMRTEVGQAVIFSNISSQYGINSDDLMSLFKLTIATHEYSHMVDNVTGLTLSKDDFNFYNHLDDNGLTTKIKEELLIKMFTVKVDKEAFGDLAAMPIALATYSKKTGIPIENMSQALSDTMLLFRASTFHINNPNEQDLKNQDVHIGSVNATLYWNDNQSELISTSQDILNHLPRNIEGIDFDRDIATSMERVYQEQFLSPEFQDQLFSSSAITIKELNSDINVVKMNTKFQVLDAISDTGYKAIFSDSDLERGQRDYEDLGIR